MNDLSFVWREPTSLATELGKPIERLSVEFVIPNSGPRFITLWRPDGTGLRLFTEMHDVAERREVGVLNFEFASAPCPGESIGDLPSAFQGEIEVSKLIIHESGSSAESGLIFKAKSGEEVVIIPSACPYSLAIQGAFVLPHIFEPEYPLDQYIRVPIL